MAKKQGDGIFEVESAETYKQLVGQVFSGTYVGLQENKDYGTERAVFQINQEDPHNKGLLQLFSTIRKLNDQSNTKVRCHQTSNHGLSFSSAIGHLQSIYNKFMSGKNVLPNITAKRKAHMPNMLE